MKAKARFLLLPASLLALVAVMVPIPLSAAPPSAPRAHSAPTLLVAGSTANAELAALELMLFVHRADLVAASRLLARAHPRLEHGK